MASPVAAHLLTMDPSNKLARAYLSKHNAAMIPQSSHSSRVKSTSVESKREVPSSSTSPSWTRRRKAHFYPELKTAYSSQTEAETALEKGLSDLLAEAKLLRSEITALNILRSDETETTHSFTVREDTEMLSNLLAISEGRISSAVPLVTPLPVSEACTVITASTSTEEATAFLISDFETVIQWFQARGQDGVPYASSSSPRSNEIDALRQRLVSRQTHFLAVLPDNMATVVNNAFAQVERVHLEKSYANDETMLGDAVSDIPQKHFFVTEDNYAWDITELVQAITANSGVMRNPLTRNMFTTTDIRRILAHPLASSLKPLRSKQMSFQNSLKYTHPDTIRKISELAKVMLEDQSADAAPSRKAIDEFLGYVVTLPDKEQEALDKFKVPAKDSHTSQAYDYTVGEAVNDAKSNVTCSHKVGDFLKQAAEFLQK
jgi:hypothetical protein